jgi:hypothetical protein
MAREAGLLTWLKPPEDVIERFKAFEALVRADERAKLHPKTIKAVQEDDYCQGDEMYYAND